jgi:hypothetical protein
VLRYYQLFSGLSLATIRLEAIAIYRLFEAFSLKPHAQGRKAVTPAKAGVQRPWVIWIPVSAGMTNQTIFATH